jgi:hypothetical protein
MCATCLSLLFRKKYRTLSYEGYTSRQSSYEAAMIIDRAINGLDNALETCLVISKLGSYNIETDSGRS